MEHTKLTQSEIDQTLINYPNWKMEEGKLVNKLVFTSFNKSFSFATQVALLAEKINHHPKIEIDFKKMRLELWTFDIVGLSQDDLVLLENIEDLAQ